MTTESGPGRGGLKRPRENDDVAVLFNEVMSARDAALVEEVLPREMLGEIFSHVQQPGTLVRLALAAKALAVIADRQWTQIAVKIIHTLGYVDEWLAIVAKTDADADADRHVVENALGDLTRAFVTMRVERTPLLPNAQTLVLKVMDHVADHMASEVLKDVWWERLLREGFGTKATRRDGWDRCDAPFLTRRDGRLLLSFVPGGESLKIVFPAASPAVVRPSESLVAAVLRTNEVLKDLVIAHLRLKKRMAEFLAAAKLSDDGTFDKFEAVHDGAADFKYYTTHTHGIYMKNRGCSREITMTYPSYWDAAHAAMKPLFTRVLLDISAQIRLFRADPDDSIIGLRRLSAKNVMRLLSRKGDRDDGIGQFLVSK